MKIIFVTPRGRHPTSLPFLDRMMRGLENLGHEVDEFMLSKTIRPIPFIRQFLALRKMLHAPGVELVNAQFGTFCGFMTALCCPLRVPLVVTFHGSDLNPTPSEHPLIWTLQHLLSQFAAYWSDGIICVSRQLASRVWWKKRILQVLPAPIDLAIFQPSNYEAARQKLGWGPAERVCLFIAGSNHTVKRLDIALAVKQALQQNNSSIRLETIQTFISSEDLAVLLNAADLLLFVSDFEGSPNLIREACACNLPILTFVVGDVVEVTSGIDGVYFAERDLSQLPTKVELLTKQGKRSHGRESMNEYSVEALSRKTGAFYHQVLAAYRRKLERPGPLRMISRSHGKNSI